MSEKSMKFISEKIRKLLVRIFPDSGFFVRIPANQWTEWSEELKSRVVCDPLRGQVTRIS